MPNPSSGSGSASNPLGEYVEWFLDHLRSERAASPHTVSAYAKDLSLASERLQGDGLGQWEEIEPGHLLAYQASLGPPLAQSSARRKLSALRTFLKFLRRNGVALRTDLPDTGGFRTAKRLPKALGYEQLQALLEAPDLSTASGLRDRVLMELIYGAGLRISEALDLEFSGLDIEGSDRSRRREKSKDPLGPFAQSNRRVVERLSA